MPDSGGTFTRTDGVRSGATVWTQAKAAAVKIVAADADTHDQDIATALNNRIFRDGGNTPSADLPMSSQKHTGVANAAARDQYGAVGQVQDGAFAYAAAGGTADVITLTLSPAITAYAAGQEFALIAGGTNTGAVTLNVNGVGAKAVEREAAALVAGDLVSGAAYKVVYDGTAFQLVVGGLTDISSKLANVVEDTTPQLGGDLDLNGNNIDFPTTANIADCLDEDNMASNSAVALATQQSIKAYVDAVTPGKLVKETYVKVSTLDTTPNNFIDDDTIPQTGEAKQFMTLVHTPLDAANIITVKTVCHLASSNGGSGTSCFAGIFKNSIAGALASGKASQGAGTDGVPVPVYHREVAGSTSAVNWRVYGSSNVGICSFNGDNGVARFGGTMASYILVQEHTP